MSSKSEKIGETDNLQDVTLIIKHLHQYSGQAEDMYVMENARNDGHRNVNNY